MLGHPRPLTQRNLDSLIPLAHLPFCPLRTLRDFRLCHFQQEIHPRPVLLTGLDSKLFDGRDHALNLSFFSTKWRCCRLWARSPPGLLIFTRTNSEIPAQVSLRLQAGATWRRSVDIQSPPLRGIILTSVLGRPSCVCSRLSTPAYHRHASLLVFLVRFLASGI